jgi:hypothetical protein
MKRRRLILLLAPFMALIAALGAVTLSSTAAEAATGFACSSHGFGTGWFVTDLSYNSTCPGGPFPVANYYSLTSWYDHSLNPPDNQMAICSGYNYPLPDGWVEVGTQTSYSTCLNPASILPPSGNITIVQRKSVGTPFIEPGGIAVYPDRTLAIYGINFYPSDQVFVNGIPATVVYDGGLERGQINATPPASVHGGATVVVQNGFGVRTAGEQITLP